MYEDYLQLVNKLMDGSPIEQGVAEKKLLAAGMPQSNINALKKEAMMRNRPGPTLYNARKLKAVPIENPPFVLADRQYRQFYNYWLQNQFNQPYRGPYSRQYVTATRRPPYTNTAQINLIPLTQLGLSVTGTSIDLTMHVRDYTKLKSVMQNGQFIANWEGKRVWKSTFRGNASVSADVVAAEKAAFNSSLKTLKILKGAGYLAAGVGTYLSYEDTRKNKNNAAGWSKFGLDVIMTGVAFIPPFGWVVSGVYFLVDGSLNVSGVDWWQSFYDNYLSKTDDVIADAFKSFAKNDAEFRRITGKGLLQGPKF